MKVVLVVVLTVNRRGSRDKAVYCSRVTSCVFVFVFVPISIAVIGGIEKAVYCGSVTSFVLCLSLSVFVFVCFSSLYLFQ